MRWFLDVFEKFQLTCEGSRGSIKGFQPKSLGYLFIHDLVKKNLEGIFSKRHGLREIRIWTNLKKRIVILTRVNNRPIYGYFLSILVKSGFLEDHAVLRKAFLGLFWPSHGQENHRMIFVETPWYSLYTPLKSTEIFQKNSPNRRFSLYFVLCRWMLSWWRQYGGKPRFFWPFWSFFCFYRTRMISIFCVFTLCFIMRA